MYACVGLNSIKKKLTFHIKVIKLKKKKKKWKLGLRSSSGGKPSLPTAQTVKS